MIPFRTPVAWTCLAALLTSTVLPAAAAPVDTAAAAIGAAAPADTAAAPADTAAVPGETTAAPADTAAVRGEPAAAPADTAAAVPAVAEPGGSAPRQAPFFLTNRRGRSRRWGLIGSGVGLVTGVGFALWVKSEADDRYDIYLNTADPDRAKDALDAAERYDRATLIGFALAQVSFVAFVYFLTREDKRTLIPAKGEPLVRPGKDGFEIGFRVAP